MSCTSVGASAFGEILDESTSIAFPCLFVFVVGFGSAFVSRFCSGCASGD